MVSTCSRTARRTTVAIDSVLKSEDLVPLVLAPLSIGDFEVACVCKLWSRKWRDLARAVETRVDGALTSLHPDLPQLRDLIDVGQFDSRPLGPLGVKIAVKPALVHLGRAIEAAMNARVSARTRQFNFIVFSTADADQLHRLLGKIQPSPNVRRLGSLVRVSVYPTPQARYQLLDPNVSGAANVPQHVHTLTSTIDIVAKGTEADAWYNLLLDTIQSAERTMIFKTVAEARAVVNTLPAMPAG